jgi:predicted ester cyclase
MSLEENKAIIRRCTEEWNKGNLEIADDLVDPKFNEMHPEGRKGPEGEKQLAAFFQRTFPPWRFETKEMIAEGDLVVVHWTVSGRHEGKYKGVAPTGKEFTVEGFNIWRISEGKIVGRHSVWDRLSLFEQVGAFP